MRLKNYDEYIERKKREYGDMFDDSDLNPNFIKYYESQERILVDMGYEKKRGRIGVTTGWKPCFLLMLRRDSTGSSYCIGPHDKVIRIVGSAY